MNADSENVEQIGAEWVDPHTGMVFVWVPPGRFIMGSDRKRDEQPTHEVEISHGFRLGKYPVTQGEWQRVIGNNPACYQQYNSDFPVEQVSWLDAQNFIKTLNKNGCGQFRLPTEAEWEYACRAGHSGDYGFEGDKGRRLG